MSRYAITVLVIVAIILAAAGSAGAAPPIAEIVSPASPVDANMLERLEFIIQGTDQDNDLWFCEMYVDDVNKGRAYFNKPESPATAKWTYAFGTPGTHIVRAAPYDMADHEGTSVQWTIEVRNVRGSLELTVLAYNTHLFEESILECICRCGGHTGACNWDDYNYEDWTRRDEIVSKVAESGADIVALQEVWAPCWQQWFIHQLEATYAYSATWDSPYACWDAMAFELKFCLGAGMHTIENHCCGDDCCAETYTLGSGLVLLSKFPFDNNDFERFPTFTQCGIGGCETWSDKGVLTATVDLGVPIRIGISHALTRPHDEKSKWDTDYVATGVTTFQLNGDAYIFALKKDNTGRIVRMEDYGRWWDEKERKYNYGAGWKHIYAGPWGSGYRNVTSFELDGHPYLFGVRANEQGIIIRINDDPSTGWTTMYECAWGVNTPNPGYDGLAAWYRFQNNVLDSSGNGRHGLPYGTPDYSADCKEDTRSIYLDGENDYVEVNYCVGINSNDPRTIAGWVRATKPAGEIPGWAGVFGFTSTGGADTHFDIQRRSGQDYYCIHVYGWEQNIIPLDQEWHHLAATYDGATIAWYADGSLVGSEDRVLNTNDHVQIGKRADKDAFFPGLVDDVRIYRRDLSQDEIGYLAGLTYVSVESFELDGHPYLFGLGSDGQARIDRIVDDPYMDLQEVCQGLWSPNDVDYVETGITSFQLDGDPYIQLDGDPYIFTLGTSGRAYINRINDDPCTGWTSVYEGDWGCSHDIVTSFKLDDHPYLFGLYQRKILRINDDPYTGWTSVYGDPRDEHLKAWYRFENNTLDSSGNGHDGTPYGGPTYSTNSREGTYSMKLDGVNDYVEVSSVGISGASPRTITGWVRALRSAGDIPGWAGIFGFTSTGGADTHFDIQRRSGHDYYCIHVNGWEENIAPLDQEWHHLAATYDGSTIAWYADGSLVGSAARVLNTTDHVQIGKRADKNAFFPGLVDDVRIYSRALSYNEIGYTAVQFFEMNGHPYLFALSKCCDQLIDSTLSRPRPGEAYLKRINDDPSTGWEDLLQLEDIRIIRDETVVDEDGPPAIMMGDFNIHAHKYGIMDRLFGKAGAVDAYIEVHGTGEGGDTVDLRNNKFHQILCQDDPTTPGNECDPDDPRVYTRGRIDYVYVKQSGAGLRLVPTEARVIRDWQYGAEDMDLSDHYPVAVKFKLFQGGCTARMKGDLNCDRLINFADFAILCSVWMSGPGDGVWDPACDISDPLDDFIDMKDIDAFVRAWLNAPPVHNVTQDKWYGFIQTAIIYAQDGDEIAVAPGTYYESIDFKRKAIRLYSTAGPNDTIIDANGAYHVVKCVNGEGPDTVLDGFTITGGNANGPTGEYQQGGGIYCKDSSPTVIDCNLSGNSAFRGGGIYCDNSSPTLTNCTFAGNTASNGSGGGMYNSWNSYPTLTNCTFTGNITGYFGGGIYVFSGAPSLTNCILGGNSATGGGGMYCWNPAYLTNCTFSNNSATDNGGGMYNYENYTGLLTNCTFTGNTVTHNGGGMYNASSNPTVTNCTFTGNSSNSHGGGICNVSNSSPTLTNCIFNGNDADGFGGGMINSVNSNANLTNCMFIGNAADYGGGIYNNDNSNAIVTNCTFSGNNAANDGGGMYNAGSNPTVTNCILWKDTPDEISNNSSNPTVTYSDVQDGYGGEGNIDADPCFVDANNPDPNLWNLRLKSNSPCIDSGDNSAVPSGVTTDLYGNPRFVDDPETVDTGSGTPPIVDMGAYEYLPSPPATAAANFKDVAILCNNWLAGTEPEL